MRPGTPACCLVHILQRHRPIQCHKRAWLQPQPFKACCTTGSNDAKTVPHLLAGSTRCWGRLRAARKETQSSPHKVLGLHDIVWVAGPMVNLLLFSAMLVYHLLFCHNKPSSARGLWGVGRQGVLGRCRVPGAQGLPEAFLGCRPPSRLALEPSCGVVVHPGLRASNRGIAD
jgi:hypothetical protein